jgi:hypothetical protein
VASAGDAREGGEQRWEEAGATRGHVQELEVELGYCTGGERRWQSGTEGKAGRQRKKKQAGVRRTCLQIEKIPRTPL